MCGIFGFVAKPGSAYPSKAISETIQKLALYSEARGKDSSGLAIRLSKENKINVIKGNISVRQLIHDRSFGQAIKTGLKHYSHGDGFCAFGHARLVTNGSQLQEDNNQPVLRDNMIVIHNGIIVNEKELWEKYTELGRSFKIDTEIIPALIRKELNAGKQLTEACRNSVNKLEGTYSLSIMFQDIQQFMLITNNGSLYYMTDDKSFITFASEAFFLKKLRKEACFKRIAKNPEIKQLMPNNGIMIGLNVFSLKPFALNEEPPPYYTAEEGSVLELHKTILENPRNRREVILDPLTFSDHGKKHGFSKLLEFNLDAIRQLKRCKKCILPETFPFIQFDDNGICNYCNNYNRKAHNNSLSILNKIVDPYRSRKGKPDCIVPFSGGRDSTYALHLIKNELNLNPIAFTYDWGMVTDLARRNIARVCGKLGVENIIVSANIHWKRENIRKNIEAWLRNPELGMIPLFMAGDKYFFYYTERLKKQTGIDLNIWGINHLENTDFKTGFAGLSPEFEKKRIYSLSLWNQTRLFSFVFKNVIKSPGYLNQSVFDSLGSFASRYISPKKDYFHLFDYYPWNEEEILDLVKNEYKWETAIDTKSTWRIGDGTASFYNYIYFTVAGFSEIDTFRSNQIREGMLEREKALKLAEEENFPRYETLRWYFEIIRLDFENAIRRVNKIPKLYNL